MEKEKSTKKRSFLGYFLTNNALTLSIVGVFGALTCLLTFIIPITIPATQGYINLGDIGVMISGILFGPIIGALAGGIGSSITDLFIAPQYAIPTLIIKGMEGFFVGLIANPKKHFEKFNFRDVIAVIVGGIIMVIGYFLTEIILYGFPSALFELFFNGAVQFGLGAFAALTFTAIARKNIVMNLPQVFDKIYIYIKEKEHLLEHS